MKKSALLCLSAIAMVACGPKAPQTISGVIVDASTSNIMIVTPTGDSISFSTTDADMSQVNGAIAGDTAIISFVGDLPNKGQNTIISATKMVGVPTIYKIEGSWVQPIPGMKGVQGVVIYDDGTASSINMATLVYDSWSKDGSELTLNGQSIGNGQSSHFVSKWKIDTLTATHLVLSMDSLTERFDRQ